MAAREKKPRRPFADCRDDPSGDTSPIEEELLASYLAGTLSADQRERVARYLANNAEAREVLTMASVVMAAERRTK